MDKTYPLAVTLHGLEVTVCTDTSNVMVTVCTDTSNVMTLNSVRTAKGIYIFRMIYLSKQPLFAYAALNGLSL